MHSDTWPKDQQPTILVTGFEPFGGYTTNPSERIARQLHGEMIHGAHVTGVILPVSARRVGPALEAALHEHRPDIVLGLGLAASRLGLSVERVAINCLEFHADNDGERADDQPIVAGAPAAYFSTLPYTRIAAGWREAGIPGTVTNSAGTYLCNQMMYLALHSTHGSPVQAGFIHVPALPEQAAGERVLLPSMSFDLMLRGVESALCACVAATRSLVVSR